LNQYYNRNFNKKITLEFNVRGWKKNIEFSIRLRDAMILAGLEPRPSVLLKLFNLHYPGRAVTFQAVTRWLRGESIPSQEKLVVLAQLLKVEPQALRYGEVIHSAGSGAAQPYQQPPDEAMGSMERQTFDAFLQLTTAQRKIVRELILALIKVQPPQEGM
jgi:transcriptional regulator with XRE-family HTH domain